MLIAYNGEKRWPDKITPYSPPPPPKKDLEEVVTKSEEEIIAEKNAEKIQSFVQNTSIATLAATALLAFGITSDSPDAVSLMSTFALAGLAGYQVVWGVAPALHSPLMAVTNAISGMTAVGGMVLLAHGTQAEG